MKIFQFSDPADYRFARASRRGSWAPSPSGGPCPECGSSRQERVQPLLLKWEPGSDLVGDFTWPGFADVVVVTDRALDTLRPVGGFELGAVQMEQDPRLQRTARAKPRVWLPYAGPSLSELWVTKWVNLDRNRSSVELERSCGECGVEQFRLHGAERWYSEWDQLDRRLVRTLSSRLPGHGVYVHATNLDVSDIFRIRELPGCVCCTEAVRTITEVGALTNVSFLEIGETVE